MGWQLTDYKLLMTENGPIIHIPVTYKDIQLPPAVINFPHTWSRSQAIRYLKQTNFCLHTTIDHDIIEDTLITLGLSAEILDITQVGLEQLVIEDDEPYIDEFGLCIYSLSRVITGFANIVKDLRYD